MAADATVAVRRAVLTLLKATSAVTALVPADRIYPPARDAAPAWPFAAYDNVLQGPFRASCMDGATVRFQISGFAKGDGEAATAIASAAMAVLDGSTLALEGGGKAHVRYLESNTLRDGTEASAWIATVRFEASVVR